MENWNLPQDWAWIPMDKIGYFRGGGTPSTSNPKYWSGTIPWVSPKDMKSLEILDTQDHITPEGLENSSAKRIPSGSILIVFRSGILAHSLPVAIAKREVAINQDLKAFMLHKAFDPYYILYALKAMSPVLLARCTKKGATVHSVEYGRFSAHALPVPYPDDPARSLDEQHRIVARINALFALTAEARDLRSVASKEAGRLMDAVMIRGLSDAKDRSSAGWEPVRLGSVVQIKSGFSCAKRNLVSAEEGIGHLRPFNVDTNGQVDLSEVYYIPPDYKDDMEDYALERGHVLFNNTNSVELVGKTALVTKPLECAFSNHIYRLTVKPRAEDRLESAWLALALRRLWARGYFEERCNRWIGQAGVNSKMLRAVKLPLPSVDEQRRIVEYVESVQVQVAALEGAQIVEAVELDHLEQSILARAFRGEL